MKSRVVQGTPVTRISRDNGQGFNGSTKPAGFAGTQSTQFMGDSTGARTGVAAGTPYNSAAKNDDKRPKTTHAKMGIVLSENGINMSDPTANGDGVVFDGVSRNSDRLATPSDVMDSPVPMGAQRPAVDSVKQLNALRNGTGKDYAASQAIPDKFAGVMSREGGNK